MLRGRLPSSSLLLRSLSLSLPHAHSGSLTRARFAIGRPSVSISHLVAVMNPPSSRSPLTQTQSLLLQLLPPPGPFLVVALLPLLLVRISFYFCFSPDHSLALLLGSAYFVPPPTTTTTFTASDLVAAAA